MLEVFVSYARANAQSVGLVTEALRAAGYVVWRDDEIPAHRPFAEVITERLDLAGAVVVCWSVEAARSEWVQSEADVGRTKRKLVQISLDGAPMPMPFDRIQCVNLAGWNGDEHDAAWLRILSSVTELVGTPDPISPASPAQLSPARPPMTLPSKPSIAVMPFANLSGDPEQAYFAEGMVAEIIEALSRFRHLFVIASGSTRSFTNRAVPARDAARQLGVRYVLEGSVRKAGNRVRITVQLIDVEMGATIWTHRFEKTLDDVFALQDEVALAVAGRIEPTINAEEYRRAVSRPTNDTDSYDLYLRGFAISRSHTRSDTLAALELLDRSIALNPDFGLALIRAAHCHRLIMMFGWSQDPAYHRECSITLSRRALQVAGDNSAVLGAVAFQMLMIEHDRRTALALIERAIEMNPGDARMFYWSGRIHLVIGDAETAISHLKQSIRLDPVGPQHSEQIFAIGLARFVQRRFEEALAYFRESGLHPTSRFVSAFIGSCLAHLGQLDEARDALARGRARKGLSLEDLVRNWLFDAEQLQLLLDGIALAEHPTMRAKLGAMGQND